MLENNANIGHEHPRKSEDWRKKEDSRLFNAWFKEQLQNGRITKALTWYATGLSFIVTTYQGYDINENMFYTRTQDSKSMLQNSGVCMHPFDIKSTRSRYSMFIDEILVLQYGEIKISMF